MDKLLCTVAHWTVDRHSLLHPLSLLTLTVSLLSNVKSTAHCSRVALQPNVIQPPVVKERRLFPDWLVRVPEGSYLLPSEISLT